MHIKKLFVTGLAAVSITSMIASPAFAANSSSSTLTQSESYMEEDSAGEEENGTDSESGSETDESDTSPDSGETGTDESGSESGESGSSTEDQEPEERKEGVYQDAETDLWYFYQDGESTLFTGFAKQDENQYLYVTDGVFQESTTGLIRGTIEGTDATWYVKNGIVDLNYTGVYFDGDDGLAITNGCYDSSYTGIYKAEDGNWYRIVDGKVDLTCNSVEENENGWFYIKDGIVDFSYTGLAKNDYGWWYIKNGKLDFSYSSVVKNDYGWWCVQKGKVNFSYTGIARNDYGWWRIVKGKVDFTCNSVEKNENGWFYLKGGKVQFDYNGIARNDNGWWYIKNGKVNFSYSGTCTIGARKYTINSGKVSSNYYMPQTSIDLPSGGYNLTTANIGLKVIKVNQKLLGTTNARYSSSTASAVKKFQSKNGLSATGTVNLATWKAMGYSEYDWYHLGTYTSPILVKNGSDRQSYIDAMLSTARSYCNAGTAYRVGCSGKPGTYVDCSGLIYQCLYAAGINPTTNIVDHALAKYEYTSAYLAADSKLGVSVSSSSMKAGDLIFYARDGRSNVCHVAIYAGNGMIYDSWPSIGVTYRGRYLSGYHIVKVTRVF